MAGKELTKQSRFEVIGVDLNAPPDALREGRYPILSNLRPEIDGTLSPRPGLGNGMVANPFGLGASVHSIKRLNDSSSGSPASIEVIGAGTTLCTAPTNLSAGTQRDTDYSGNPLTLVVAQPPESVSPAVYVADSRKTGKIDVAGAVKPIGLMPPTAAPSAALAAPAYKIIEEFNAAGTWAVDGVIATALGTATRVNPATTNVTAILYDSGTTGWACVQPTNTISMNEGMRITIDAGGAPEIVTMRRLFRNSQATTIAAILYERLSVVPGFAWLHLTTPVEEVDIDSLLSIGGIGAEYARVQAVEITHDGYTSVRVFLANAHAAGDAVQVVASFRAYFTANHAPGVTLSATCFQFNCAAGTGKLTNVGGSATIDLSAIAAGLPTQPDDLMHIDMFISDPSKVSEVKLYLDIDSATHDWTRNYLVHVLRSNDFTPVTTGTQTLVNNRQTSYQRDLIDAAGPQQRYQQEPTDVTPAPVPDTPSDKPLLPSSPPLGRSRAIDPSLTPPGQLNAGQSQWSSIKFRISELLTPDLGRVGSDTSRGLANVSGLKIEVNATSGVAVSIDAWWIGGGSGPDVGADRPFIYCYRALDSSTGVRSNWSPAMRGGVFAQRDRVTVTAAAQPTPCDKIEFARLGGSLEGWYYAGTIDNTAPYQFADNYPPIELVFDQALTDQTNEHYPLWPVQGPPIAGTCSAAGTLLSLGASLALGDLLAPGTAIQVGGKDFTLYRTRDTNTATHVADKLELTQSAGNLPAGTPWRIASPIYINARPIAGAAATSGTPLPVLAGPFNGYYLGAGDPFNPDRLYYARDPDFTRDDNWIEIGNASAPIQNVLLIEGRAFVFTTEVTYALEPAFTLAEQGGGLFIARQVPNSIGMWSRWAVCAAGDNAAFLSKDGIYETSGGTTRCMTEDLRILFPHESNLGVAVGGFSPPNMVSGQESNFQLAYVDHELIFNYIGVDGAYHSIVRRTTPASSLAQGYQLEVGWRPYEYSPAIRVHYAEEGAGVHAALAGSQSGRLFRIGRLAADDAGAAISWKVRTPSLSGADDEQRVRKYYMDLLLDYDTRGDTFSLTPGFDNHAATLAPTTINAPAGRTQQVIDLNSGQGQRGRNISIEIAGTSTTNRPALYLWQFTLSLRPETSLLRGRDYELLLSEGGVVYLRGLWIYADTFAATRSALFEYTRDNGTTANLTIANINHATLTERYYPIIDPATGIGGVYLIAGRLRPTDANSWELAGARPDGEPAPPLTSAVPDFTDFGEARFVQGVRYTIDTQSAPINMAIRVDENVVQTTIMSGGNSGPVVAAGRAVKAYSFDEPFITHLIRSEPSAPCRVWKAEYISEPEPEMAYMWWAQQTDCGISGYKYFGDGQLTVRSTDEIVLEFDLDGAGTFAVQAVFYDASTNSAGERRAMRFRCPVMKCKLIQPRVRAASAAGRIALYKKEFSIEVKGWGEYHVSIDGKAIGEAWQTQNLLGALHYKSGAEI
jgi:hypothetical protein